MRGESAISALAMFLWLQSWRGLCNEVWTSERGFNESSAPYMPGSTPTISVAFHECRANSFASVKKRPLQYDVIMACCLVGDESVGRIAAFVCLCLGYRAQKQGRYIKLSATSKKTERVS